MTLPSKTILVPSGDADLRQLIAAESPVPVNVVSNPSHPLGPSDLAILEATYMPESIAAFEMFPQTSHVEAVIAMTRRDRGRT